MNSIENKKLSIIIPYYNSLKDLLKLLNTIPEKDDIEVIVVDDHSENKVTPNVSLKKNVFIYENKNNKKFAGTARNYGIEKSRGEYILFADADDIFVSDFYETIEKVMKDNTSDIVYFPYKSITIEGQEEYKFINSVEKCSFDKKSELDLRSHFVVPWSKLFRAEFIKKEKILFDSTRYANDMMFSVKSGIKARTVSAYNKIIYIYQRNEGSLTYEKKYKQEGKLLVEKVYRRYYNYLCVHLKRTDKKLLGLSLKGYISNRLKLFLVSLKCLLIKK